MCKHMHCWLGSLAGGPGLVLGILVSSWEALGLSWAAPGLLLGRLGHSWAVLVGSWPVLGVSWVRLGGSGAFLGAKLEPRWTPRGTKSTPRPSKIEAKTVQNDVNM
mgnify:CR=1 FL=1